MDIHAPLDPVPDNDWVGETWGLFWPDTELEDKSEDPNKYIKVVVLMSEHVSINIVLAETL